jgi:hypothetical protein
LGQVGISHFGNFRLAGQKAQMLPHLSLLTIKLVALRI